jgi:hypothetical protein
VFEEAGYTALTPGWPDDPETVGEATAKPEVLADETVGRVADHFDEITRGAGEEAGPHRPLVWRPARADPRRARAGPRPRWQSIRRPFAAGFRFRSSALKSAWPVLGNPANRTRAIPLAFEQFRFAFANAVSEEEAKRLYEAFTVPASGVPLFQAATVNLNPVDRGDGRHRKPGPRAVADHFRREGPYGPVGDRGRNRSNFGSAIRA